MTEERSDPPKPQRDVLFWSRCLLQGAAGIFILVFPLGFFSACFIPWDAGNLEFPAQFVMNLLGKGFLITSIVFLDFWYFLLPAVWLNTITVAKRRERDAECRWRLAKTMALLTQSRIVGR